jgi:hypothetical protein
MDVILSAFHRFTLCPYRSGARSDDAQD